MKAKLHLGKAQTVKLKRPKILAPPVEWSTPKLPRDPSPISPGTSVKIHRCECGFIYGPFKEHSSIHSIIHASFMSLARAAEEGLVPVPSAYQKRIKAACERLPTSWAYLPKAVFPVVPVRSGRDAYLRVGQVSAVTIPVAELLALLVEYRVPVHHTLGSELLAAALADIEPSTEAKAYHKLLLAKQTERRMKQEAQGSSDPNVF